MLKFDYKRPAAKTPGKLILTSTDKDLFDSIREHFSVENTGARFARRYARFAPSRKYVITPTGNAELGLYWSIRQYLIANDINVPIEVTPALTKATTQIGIKNEMITDFHLHFVTIKRM